MTLKLPDGSPFDSNAILQGNLGQEPLAPPEVTEANYFFTHGDVNQSAWGSDCPTPSPWRATGSTSVRGTTFYPISRVYGPSVVDETITLTSDRTVTKGTEVGTGVGVSIGILEAQAHVKLEASVTTHLGESQTFLLRKGASVHLLAQIIYRQTSLTRTTYAGPNCQGHAESTSVLTPINYAVIIGRA